MSLGAQYHLQPKFCVGTLRLVLWEHYCWPASRLGGFDGSPSKGRLRRRSQSTLLPLQPVITQQTHQTSRPKYCHGLSLKAAFDVNNMKPKKFVLTFYEDVVQQQWRERDVQTGSCHTRKPRRKYSTKIEVGTASKSRNSVYIFLPNADWTNCSVGQNELCSTHDKTCTSRQTQPEREVGPE